MVWKNQLKKTVGSALREIETRVDYWKHNIRQRLGRCGSVQILAFRGFGRSDAVQLSGRVLEDKALAKPTDETLWWENIVAMYHRFESDEIPNVDLSADLNGQSARATTGPDGYFHLVLEPSPPLESGKWHDVHLEISGGIAETTPTWATGQVLVPDETAEFGIISDIDDTVLQSHATDWLRMARVTLLGNARTRLPFEGVAEFYQALVDGSDGKQNNPIFYVSSSSWNLYDLLVDFFDHQQIPPGPLLLRDIGIDKHQFFVGNHDHKAEKIDRILSTFPTLPFILIGDSGQEDPRIYYEVIQRHPRRIRAVYIRDISRERRDAVRKLIKDVSQVGVEMVLISSTADAADHALQRGFVAPAANQRVVEKSEAGEREL